MTEYVKIPNIFKRETFGKNKLIEGEYSSPELEYLKDAEWEFTYKANGTNIRICWDGYRVSFMGRTDKAQIPAHLLARLEELFGGEYKEELFEQTFGNKEVILFGEGIGEKIQKGGGLYGSADFVLFDVYIGGYWLNREAVEHFAEVFGISVDELMQIKAEAKSGAKKDITPMVHMILKAISLAMGVGVVVLSILKELDVNSGIGMLGIGLACLAITSLAKRDEED